MENNSTKRKQFHGFIVIYFVTFLLVHANSQNTTVIKEDEKAILLKLKSYVGNSSDIQQRWNLRSSPCSWPGISCTRGFVKGIDLGSQGLTAIPPNICKLRNLKLLRLRGNLLSGVFPKALYNCSKLEVLDLSYNQFREPMPMDIHRMPRLTTLNLGRNNFTGLFPTVLYNCSKLKHLDLSENQFHGPLPVDIHRMSRLTTLYLSENLFDGTIPGAIGQLSELKLLYLGSNNFEGSIPFEIGNLPNLKYLDISDMEKFGLATIPDELGKLKNLKYLKLSRSNLIGSIPEAFSSLSGLEIMVLSENKLNGSIPNWLFQFTKLKYLSLDHNQLSGSLPSLNGEVNFSFLDLSWNKLSGVIPLEFDKYSVGFSGNVGLCTSNSTHATNIDLCNSDSNHDHTHHKTRIKAIVAAIGVLVTVVVVYIFCYILKHSKLSLSKPSSSNDDWNFTSFQSTNFRESEILQNLTEENLIGSGGSGSVYRIAVNNNTSHVGVKRIKRKLDNNLEKQFLAEVQTLSGIRHANIVMLICCISTDESRILVYDYMENQSLDKWLHPKNSASPATNVVMNWDTRLRIAIGAARGLCYMHHDCSPPIIHRDIKSSNILLDDELNAKVADFGLAKVLAKRGHTETASSIAGTFGYIAPEYANTSKVSIKSDVYSFGVVLLELVTGKKAVSRDDHMNLAQRSWRHVEEDKPIEDALDEAIKEPGNVKAMRDVFKLAVMCTNKVASNRPSMKEVLQLLLLFIGKD